MIDIVKDIVAVVNYLLRATSAARTRTRGSTPAREKSPTKLNADKTRFDPEPVGVLLTFRFRDCSRPLRVRYERTLDVPECQYPFHSFSKVAAPEPPGIDMTTRVAISGDHHETSVASA